MAQHRRGEATAALEAPQSSEKMTNDTPTPVQTPTEDVESIAQAMLDEVREIRRLIDRLFKHG